MLLPPSEVWEIIFSHCSINSKKALFELNSYFYNLCGDFLFQQQKLKKETMEKRIQQGLKNNFKSSFIVRHMFHLFFTTPMSNPNHYLTQPSINYLMKYMNLNWFLNNKER